MTRSGKVRWISPSAVSAVLVNAKNCGRIYRDDPGNYTLFMAEDTGEIEADLPPLNSAEIVGRVGFPALALVDRPDLAGNQCNHVITV